MMLVAVTISWEAAICRKAFKEFQAAFEHPVVLEERKGEVARILHYIQTLSSPTSSSSGAKENLIAGNYSPNH